MKVIIVDDELIARQRLERLVGAIDGVSVAAVASGGKEALAAVREHAPDVLLLDVRMPDLSGLEVASLLDGVPVIFVTAHAEHAVEAFSLAATDYLLKPVDPQRLRAALERVATRTSRPGPTSRLPIKTQKGVVLVDPVEITHAVLSDELVEIATEAQTWLSDWTLNALEARLPDRFVRVSRQAILNLDKVALLEPTDSGGYLARTSGGALVQVSRQAARGLRRALGI
jgi:two-component system LytT family response regulator